MKCYMCNKEACAKVGTARGNIWNALLNRKVWDKREVFLCRDCYDNYIKTKEVKPNMVKEETKSIPADSVIVEIRDIKVEFLGDKYEIELEPMKKKDAERLRIGKAMLVQIKKR